MASASGNAHKYDGAMVRTSCALDGDRRHYWSGGGDLISGMYEVVVPTTKKKGVTVNKVVVALCGELKVSWKTAGETSSRLHEVTRVVCNKTKSYDIDDSLLVTGTHEFPFNFNLPTDAPPTFGNAAEHVGRIRYFLKLSFDERQIGKTTIRVRKLRDNDLHEHGSRPAYEHAAKSFFLASGKAELDIDAPRTSLCFGDDIVVRVRVRNNSAKTIKSVKCKLVEYIDFTCKGDTVSAAPFKVPLEAIATTTTTTTTTTDAAVLAAAAAADVAAQRQAEAGVAPRGGEVTLNYLLAVPPSSVARPLNPTMKTIEKLISVSHAVVVTAAVGGLAADLRASLPLCIQEPHDIIPTTSPLSISNDAAEVHGLGSVSSRVSLSLNRRDSEPRRTTLVASSGGGGSGSGGGGYRHVEAATATVKCTTTKPIDVDSSNIIKKVNSMVLLLRNIHELYGYGPMVTLLENYVEEVASFCIRDTLVLAAPPVGASRDDVNAFTAAHLVAVLRCWGGTFDSQP